MTYHHWGYTRVIASFSLTYILLLLHHHYNDLDLHQSLSGSMPRQVVYGSLSQQEHELMKEGYSPERNVRYDGVGQLDYLRGEPPNARIRSHVQMASSFENLNPLLGQQVDMVTQGGVEMTLSGSADDLEVITPSQTDHVPQEEHEQEGIFTQQQQQQQQQQQDFGSDLFLHGTVQLPPSSMSDPQNSHGGETIHMNYLHCGPTFRGENSIMHQSQNGAQIEMILLHAVGHSFLEWQSTSILAQLCSPPLPYGSMLIRSVTALDLDPFTSGVGLHLALLQLQREGIIVSDRGVVVVTPGDSGRSLLDLGDYASQIEEGSPGKHDKNLGDTPIDLNEEDETLLSLSVLETPLRANTIEQNEGMRRRLDQQPNQYQLQESKQNSRIYQNDEEIMESIPDNMLLVSRIRAWIDISTISVLETTSESLRSFLLASTPVLSIHGSLDETGQRVTQKLVSVAGAAGVGMEGLREDCYLKSGGKFVKIVLEFLQGRV